MPDLTPEAHPLLATVARLHDVSVEAAQTVLNALAAGGGKMAQFNHPELGGMGQWARGGLVMVGDMFNQGLKHRVDALCSELASQLQNLTGESVAGSTQTQSQGDAARHGISPGFATADEWPPELGRPSTSGAQNGLRYAYFPATRRLAIQRDGRLELYDTGDHQISGVSQQQGGMGQSSSVSNDPMFRSDQGPIRLSDLKRADAGLPSQPQPSPSAAATPSAPAEPIHATMLSSPASSDPLAIIERMAGLRQKGILTEEEFAAKKAELLSRL